MHQIYRTSSFALTFSESSVTDKIQLFRTGTFYHPEYGKFEITPQLLQEIKKNFDDRVRGVDLAIDYSHENQDIAAGWVKGLELADDGKALYATVDWTPKGKQVVQDKEFRYISPEFSFAYKDNETLTDHGATLMGAALTNRPVIKKMEPVVELTEIKYEEQKPIEEPKVENKITDLKSTIQKKGENKMGMPDKKLADMTPEEMKAMSPEEMMALIAEMQKKIAGFEQEATAAAEAKACAEKKASFAKLLSEGKACAAQEEAFIKGDMAKFIELAQPVKLSEAGNANVPEVTVDDEKTKSIDDKIHALAEKKMTDKTAKSLSEAYQMVLNENADLRKEKYGK
jgi:hypothetical protein